MKKSKQHGPSGDGAGQATTAHVPSVVEGGSPNLPPARTEPAGSDLGPTGRPLPVFVEIAASTDEVVRVLLHKIVGRIPKMLTPRGALID